MNTVKKVSAYILVFIILFLTIFAILGIWDIISFEDVIKKTISSLFVIFISAVIVLFIFSVLIKDSDKKQSAFNKNKASEDNQ